MILLRPGRFDRRLTFELPARVACEAVGAAGMGGSLVSLAAVGNGPRGDTNLVGRTLADRNTRPEVDRLLAVSKSLRLDRRGKDRRRTDHLADADPTPTCA